MQFDYFVYFKTKYWIVMLLLSAMLLDKSSRSAIGVILTSALQHLHPSFLTTFGKSMSSTFSTMLSFSSPLTPNLARLLGGASPVNDPMLDREPL